MASEMFRVYRRSSSGKFWRVEWAIAPSELPVLAQEVRLVASLLPVLEPEVRLVASLVREKRDRC